jgi:hypothetical protein
VANGRPFFIGKKSRGAALFPDIASSPAAKSAVFAACFGA